MPLTPGQKLGSYEIVSQLGAGGMGEVYRARDSKLKRDVAIKVLPDDVAADRERLARFQREAEVLASLNHPHIAHVYGIEENALVMELVDGDDLSVRIKRGPIPLDEALPIAKQIAEALEAAHDHGVIHRDLKPANVKVRDDGTVKVLDFGLAKALDPGAGSRPPGTDVTNSPTITSPAMTMRGVILGTAAYMSPEQARGKAVDRRADIWAFGCVLYEMLTGRRVFQGDDVTDIITSVMRDTPDWNTLPGNTPASIGTLLKRCLEKDQRKRTPHIAVARLDIENAITGSDAAVTDAAPKPSRAISRLIAVCAAGVILAATGWTAGRFSAPTASSGMPLRFTVDGPVAVPSTARNTAFISVSPDGTRMIFTGQPRGKARQLFLHSFADGTSRPLDDTENASAVFWSPDSRAIAFNGRGGLQRLDLASGAMQTIATGSTAGYPGTWNADGVILFGNGAIYKVPAKGGSPIPITTIDAANGEIRHDRPTFLPDGRHFTYVVIGDTPEKSLLRYADLESTETRGLGNISSGADYMDPGFLVYVKDAKAMARPFNAAKGDWSGDAVVVANSVRQQAMGAAALSASRNGVIVFDPVPIFGQQIEELWVDRAGKVLSTFSSTEAGHTMALAPGDNIAVLEQSGTIWIADSKRGTRTPLTPDRMTHGHPIWSPDGKRIGYFEGLPGAVTQLFIKSVNGTGDPEPLVPPSEQTKTTKQPTDWSKDGRYFVFEEQTANTSWDLNYVDLTGDRKVTPLLHHAYSERLGQLSPDGKYLAYESSESGKAEIYVTDFPAAKERWPISTQGGGKPRWNDNGREIVYVDGEGKLQSVSLSFNGGVQASAPIVLFESGGIETDGFNYAISHDGSKFLIVRPSRTAPTPRLSVVVNWPATVRTQ